MFSDYQLTDQVVLITGGSQGIGLACAQRCLDKGARVMMCARNAADLNAAQRQLAAAYPDRILAQVADVTNAAALQSAIAALEQQWGAMTAVIHAAGVYGPIGKIDTLDADEWWNGIDINLRGTFLVLQQACRVFAQRRAGSIVVFSGGGATSPFPHYSSYAAGKAGVVRLMETAAEEYRDAGLRINAVAPGFVRTRLHQQTLAAGAEKAGAAFLQKTQQQLEQGSVPPEVGANAAAFLISPQAAGITGKLLAAPYDSIADWVGHADALRSDIFTLRRIVPRDRGMDWQ